MTKKERRKKPPTMDSIAFKLQLKHGQAVERRNVDQSNQDQGKGREMAKDTATKAPTNIWSKAEEEFLIKSLVDANKSDMQWDAFWTVIAPLATASRKNGWDKKTEKQIRSKLYSIIKRAKKKGVALHIPKKKPVLEQNLDDAAFLSLIT